MPPTPTPTPTHADSPAAPDADAASDPSDADDEDDDGPHEVEPILVRPMLATSGTLGMVSRGEWALEWKWDGIRVLARADGGGIRLLSRRGNDVTATYPELAGLPRVLRGDALVDGEIVALDEEGRPSFERMQQRMNLSRPRRSSGCSVRCPCGCCCSTCSRSRAPR